MSVAPGADAELTRLKQLDFSFTQETEMCREKEAIAAAVRQELQSAAAASPATGALVARLDGRAPHKGPPHPPLVVVVIGPAGVGSDIPEVADDLRVSRYRKVGNAGDDTSTVRFCVPFCR